MKLLRISVAAILALAAALIGGCSDDEGIDNRDLDYGYVQFKLYKEASYDAVSRAQKPQLDYLYEAAKVQVSLDYNGTTVTQTLTLTASDKESAEFGLRSEKLRLLTGQYRIITFSLYDANDELIYNGMPLDDQLVVEAGGLKIHDLTVDVEPRGKVRFTIRKDLSDFTETPVTRAANRQYTFDEIAFIDLTVRHAATNEQTIFKMLPTKFSIHFDEDDDTFGYQTSSLECDTLLSLKAGSYKMVKYETYDTNKLLLETNERPKNLDFVIEDNKITETKVGITLYEADEYIRDYYALYEIWKALDGPNWYFSGENYPAGTNWDFNKDPDLWGIQPGVEVHSNGRVAKITLSDFGFRGHLPAAIGQLTQLIELYLGSHDDANLLEYDPSIAPDKSLSERNRTRMERNKEFLRLIHTPTQTSEPIARALKEHNLTIPGISLYEENYTEDEIIDRKTGLQNRIRPYDVVHGKLTNGLESIDPAIGKLENLEYLFIANGEIETLPDELANLKSLTDVDVYNCPKMKQFPMALANLPEMISLNIANNSQWSAEEVYKGLDAIANGPSKEKLQILYVRQNNLKEVPESFSNLKKIGLLDLAQNQIETIHPLGEVAPVQFFLDNNKLTSLPTDENGLFCSLDDIERFSATYNKFTKFPNIFSAKSKFTITEVDFSYNEIDGFEGEEDGSFKGLNIEQLSLAANKLTKYPKCLGTTGSFVAYIILRGNMIDEIPEGSFSGKYSTSLVSLDLTYNNLSELPKDFTAEQLPYLYGLDISYNAFANFPRSPLNCAGLTVYAIRGQRDAQGNRCLREWPTGLYQHTGLRGFYIGSNDLRKIDDTISYLIYYLDISDNPNITFDASAICYYWQQGVYNLIYDKTQNILNCDKMLE
ncbi:MAG: DUF4458 domain-containing protein [Alistipes sp.]|uniref:DUF4458 domain-containing protein n=1 Tax=Alistipes sp. TaxID=1872444 RepID=UPI0025C3B53C|nr:DUF4458 domain-containing protein [Alistipes sp.]MCD8275675.1 DUF4458 domain-containing protein [Alistipes sp.]